VPVVALTPHARLARERARRAIGIGLGYAISTLFICERLLLGAGQAIRQDVALGGGELMLADQLAYVVGASHVCWRSFTSSAEPCEANMPRLLRARAAG
jgi:hypothetical protein